jgi:hypothetical protein
VAFTRPKGVSRASVLASDAVRCCICGVVQFSADLSQGAPRWLIGYYREICSYSSTYRREKQLFTGVREVACTSQDVVNQIIFNWLGGECRGRSVALVENGQQIRVRLHLGYFGSWERVRAGASGLRHSIIRSGLVTAARWITWSKSISWRGRGEVGPIR